MKKKLFRERYYDFKVLTKEELKEAKAEVIVKEEKPKKRAKKGDK